MPRSVKKNMNRKNQRTKRKQLRRNNKKQSQRKPRTNKKQLRRNKRTRRKMRGGSTQYMTLGGPGGSLQPLRSPDSPDLLTPPHSPNTAPSYIYTDVETGLPNTPPLTPPTTGPQTVKKGYIMTLDIKNLSQLLDGSGIPEKEYFFETVNPKEIDTAKYKNWHFYIRREGEGKPFVVVLQKNNGEIDMHTLAEPLKISGVYEPSITVRGPRLAKQIIPLSQYIINQKDLPKFPNNQINILVPEAGLYGE